MASNRPTAAFRGARADDLTVIDNDDLVGLSGIRNCCNNDGCITRYLSQSDADFGVGARQGGERVVEHIDGRTSDDLGWSPVVGAARRRS